MNCRHNSGPPACCAPSHAQLESFITRQVHNSALVILLLHPSPSPSSLLVPATPSRRTRPPSPPRAALWVALKITCELHGARGMLTAQLRQRCCVHSRLRTHSRTPQPEGPTVCCCYSQRSQLPPASCRLRRQLPKCSPQATWQHHL